MVRVFWNEKRRKYYIDLYFRGRRSTKLGSTTKDQAVRKAKLIEKGLYGGTYTVTEPRSSGREKTQTAPTLMQYWETFSKIRKTEVRVRSANKIKALIKSCGLFPEIYRNKAEEFLFAPVYFPKFPQVFATWNLHGSLCKMLITGDYLGLVYQRINKA